ncbi:recombinase family protein [Sphingomonas sp. BIUV-7]|uniref:Recombinase family protein n=1 Tax=Sphingomonas natans TaxID=3063330 RepID=A0ABT8YDR9_9SPHN|nr:recombinase family protein [Sphingomonas sp. BIUV-7]MDO6415933.1 recombinase family protein [Sphingomonas sp. BIUV-7]
MRTVIYARFSSDNQNPRSVDDQIAACRARAECEGWTIIAEFRDAALSGAAGIGEDQRPGMNAMLRLVEAGGIDQVLAESTDRVARHIADAHTIRERIEFAGARLFTLFDGTVTPMIGLLKGFMDSQFRTDLGARVRRGQRGALAQGRSSGGPAYGYRRANRLDEKGNLIAGLREIEPDRAEIVIRIFREFVAGRSPRAIAERLNAEGVAPPRQGFWQTGTISGSPSTGFGILRNRIYIGRIVYGRSKVVTNPQTRRKMMRPGDPSQIVEQEVPRLRIVPEDLWQAAQDRLEAGRRTRPERQRRPKHLLSGLGVCAVCGTSWTKITGDHWGCRNNRNGGTCTNNRMINSRLYQERVLADLQAGMLAPDVVAAYVREYHRDFARRSASLAKDRARLDRKLAEVQRRLDRLIEAFTSGFRELPEIRDALATARTEKEALGRELASLEALPTVLALHPRLEEEYRRQIADLQTALAMPEAADEAVPRLRAMIARIIVRPSEERRGVEIEVVRQIDEVLSLATGLREIG